MGNSKKSEQAAVKALFEYFIDSKRVDCNIPTNDKGLLWDDSLHFHSAEPFSAENLIARIPVQVKGRSLRWKKSINEYSIKRAALENYAKEGGIAYFVVDTANRKTPVIYYNLLTLVDIRHLFMRQDGERELRVMFERLDLPLEEFESRLLEFIGDKEKQSSFAHQPMATRELLLSQEAPTLEFSIPISKGMNPMHALALGGYHHIYMKTKEGISLPIQDGPFQLQMGTTVYQPVKVGDTIYYSNYYSTIGKGETEIIIGNCLFLSGFVTKDTIGFRSSCYTMHNGTLSEKITELSFIKDLIEKKDLVVGEHHWRSVQFDKEGEILDMIKASLPFWKRIKQTLDGLGVKKELSIIDMTDDDFEWLRWLDNLFNKNHVVLSKKEQKLFQRTKIANLELLFSFEKVRDGEYRVGNAFEDKDEFRLPLVADSSVTMPIYSCLPVEAFVSLDNIPYEDMVKSYERIQKPLPDALTAANFDVLHMLEAYDKTNSTRLFSAIKEIADWLYSHESFPSEIAYLNRMQIVKRERVLTDSEIDELLDFADEMTDKQMKLGTLILADEHKQAKRIFNRLNANEQKYFMSYPIAKFFHTS